MKNLIKIVESTSSIKKTILDIIILELNKIVSRAVHPIEAKIKTIVLEALKSQPEYSSLTSANGLLRIEFGIPDVGVVDNILDEIVSTSEIIMTKLKIAGSGVSGGFKYVLLSSSQLHSITKSPSASHTSEKGVQLEWLRWLSIEGTSPIVMDYTIELGPNPRSRTGQAVMVKSSNQVWRVPPEFAGVSGSNWITRAISGIESEIQQIIQNEIEAQS